MDISYFDNAATTFPKPDKVYDFTENFNRNYGVNVGRGQYFLASSAQNTVDETREILLSLLNANNKDVVFTPSATIALNIIIRGIDLKNGANVYISPFEHNAVTRVLEYLKIEKQINIRLLKFNVLSGEYDLESIDKDFKKNNPDAIILSHASNVCGIICPVEKICTLGKEYESINILDMSQTAGLVTLDLSSNIYDFAVFAGHKTLYSYIGVGGFIMKKNIDLKPLIYGGTGYDSSNIFMPESIPEKFESGSMNIQAISSLNASIKWIKEIGIDNILQKEKLNRDKIINIIEKYNDFKIIGNYKNCDVGIVSVVHKDLSADNIGKILSDRDIEVRTGLHCSPLAHKTLGTYPAGTTRISTGYFNKEKDFMELESALEYIDLNV